MHDEKEDPVLLRHIWLKEDTWLILYGVVTELRFRSVCSICSSLALAILHHRHSLEISSLCGDNVLDLLIFRAFVFEAALAKAPSPTPGAYLATRYAHRLIFLPVSNDWPRPICKVHDSG